MRIPDLLAAWTANMRIRKLSKQLKRKPSDKDLKAELWFRCHQFTERLARAYGFSLPDQALGDWFAADALETEIEKQLGRTEIADRIEHLDPLLAQGLRDVP